MRELTGIARTSKAEREVTQGVVKVRQDAFAWIPLEGESLATIKFLGYTDEKAMELWERWEADAEQDRFRVDFIHYVLPPRFDGDNKFHDNMNAWDEDDDWRGVTEKWGLSEEFQDAIMDPEFDNVRFTESLRAWVYGTIKLRYDTLLLIESMGAKGLLNTTTNNTSKMVNELMLHPCDAALLESGKKVTESKQPESQEMRVLYTPIQASQAFKLFYSRRFRKDPAFSEDFFDSLQLCYEYPDTIPADFANWSEENETVYYSSQVLASKFARYSARRSNGHSPATVIKMSFPTSALENLRVKILCDEPLWRTVVWQNRVELNLEEGAIPLDWQDQLLDPPPFDLVAGPISWNKGKAMGKNESWKKMHQSNVLLIDEGGKSATPLQFVFWDEDWPAKLGAEIRVEKLDL